VVFQTVPVKVTNLVGTSTDKESIALSWDAITSETDTGFSAVTDYEVWWDSGAEDGSDLIYLDSSGLSTTFSKGSLTTGANYRFASLARNVHGPGPLSDEETILVADVPDKMNKPAVNSGGNNDISISWTVQTIENGAEVTSYRLKILSKITGLYAEETTL
jgi:hypothetical protein